MTTPEKALVFILRFVAILQLLAIPAVVMPFDWMSVIHSTIGLGELPNAPIVSYLARSTSMFYAIHGAVTLYITFDIKRYLPLLRIWAIGILVMGTLLLIIDVAIGMPPWWTVGEGPFVIAYGYVVLWLRGKLERPEVEESQGVGM